MKTKKRLLAVIMLLALILSGCGGEAELMRQKLDALGEDYNQVYSIPDDSEPTDSVPTDNSAENPEPQKTITIGVFGGGIDELVMYEINESDLNYQVEIFDYYKEYGDGAKQQLITDLDNGDAPDIFDMNSLKLDVEYLAVKGILEDLYPWLEADEDLDKDDFVRCALSACEVDGGLYAVMSGFEIYTMYCSTSTADSLSGWSMEDLYPYSDSIGSSLSDFKNDDFTKAVTIERSDFFFGMCDTLLASYVDYSTGEVNFDSEELIELLEVCKGMEKSYIDKQPEFRLCQVFNFFDIEYAELAMGEELVYLGIPGFGDGDCRNYISNKDNYFAMNAASENKEEAWDFIRRYLLPENQSEFYLTYRTSLHFPTNRDTLNALVEKSQSVVYAKDKNGQDYEVKARGFYQNFENALASDEHIAKIMALIDSECAMPSNDMTINDIIWSEGDKYFSGRLSAQEAAENIQSRVEQYLAEQGK